MLISHITHLSKSQTTLTSPIHVYVQRSQYPVKVPPCNTLANFVFMSKESHYLPQSNSHIHALSGANNQYPLSTRMPDGVVSSSIPGE